MKNKVEREAFLKDYANWPRGVFNSILALNLKFYEYRFKNGASVIVTEVTLPEYKNVKYNLIIPPDDNYNPFDQNSGHAAAEFKAYNLHGIGIGTIVDYMTKRRDVI